MPPSFPTPHPLKPLAGFAYEPSLTLILFIIGVIIGFFFLGYLIVVRRARPRRVDFRSSLSVTCAELERLSALEPKASLTTASTAIKRVLASLDILEIRQLNISSLEKLLPSLAPSGRKLLERVIQLDSWRFKRDISESQRDVLLNGLPDLLREFVESEFQKQLNPGGKK